ncbi:SDR family NAD(P)-dependent oxidoreductase [Sphingobium estronivorans]|uniref:SDR family NAD(P)-dependent oxidoreductase n=1 Tax=Sphingobium estronivorans TaxID=1577690 RepID=UPI00123BF4B9|nr:SDR family oxidoreductase [Sphingobium estronivorans]
MRLDKRIAIVTGAGSGIGAAIARRFAAEGASVIAADINADAVARTAEGQERIVGQTCDVTGAGAVDSLVDDVVARFGRIDLMVNNVGQSVAGLLTDATDEEWNRVLALTLSSTFYGTRAALRAMLPNRSGSIINISSGAGFAGAPGLATYGAAKAGVNHLTQSAAVENARSGVRINAIAPGSIETPAILAWANNLPGGVPAYEATLLPGRFGRPEEIAAAALFLATDEASFVNGVILSVDGAASARMPAIAPPDFDK